MEAVLKRVSSDNLVTKPGGRSAVSIKADDRNKRKKRVEASGRIGWVGVRS